MSQPTSFYRHDLPDGPRSELTPWTFVRAAGRANLLVATLVSVELSGIAVVKHDPNTFQLILWAVPLLTLVIWGTAAVLCLTALASRRLGQLSQSERGLRGVVAGPARGLRSRANGPSTRMRWDRTSFPRISSRP